MSNLTEWSKKLNNLLGWLFAGLFFLTPLVLWPKTSELFEFNKMLLVYVFTLIIAGVFFIKSVLDKKLTITRTPIDIGLILFLLSQVLATLFSINIHTSIWGYYSRFHGGLASTVAYITLFYLLVSFFGSLTSERRQKTLQLLLYSILSSATLVAIYGVLEHLGIDKNLWVQDVQNRVFSTLGQPNWLSAYLAALLPLPIHYVLTNKNRNKKIIWGTIACLYLATILFTRSRSGIATTFIILAIIAVREIIRRHSQTQVRTAVGIFVGLAAILILFGSPWTPSPQELQSRATIGGPLWPEVEPILNKVHLTSQLKPLDRSQLSDQARSEMDQRDQGIRVGGSSSLEIRQVVWQGAFELFKKHPWLGTGVETFGYSYYWTRPVAHNMLSEWDFLYNKAHNEYVNFLATTGVIGLGSYLIMVGFILALFIKEMRRKDPLAFPMLVGFLAILITNYFGFSVVVVAEFFFLFPALLMFVEPEREYKTLSLGSGWNLSKKDLKHHQYNLAIWQYLSFVAIGLAVFWGVWQIFKQWRADLLYNEGKLYEQAGYLGQSMTFLESATSLYPTEPVIRAQLAETYSDVALAIQQKINDGEATSSAALLNQAKQQRDYYGTKANQEIATALDQNPWHLNFWKSKAKIELTLALIDPHYYEQALTTLSKANELAPTDPKIVYNIGLIYEQLGKFDQAKQAFQKALELKPDYDSVKAELERLTKTR